jgi:hypothetical protein
MHNIAALKSKKAASKGAPHATVELDGINSKCTGDTARMVGLASQPGNPKNRWNWSSPLALVVVRMCWRGSSLPSLASITCRHSHLSPSISLGALELKAFSTSRASTLIPHVIVITLSNLFTTPLATGTPFTWKDLTPLARLALDEFILWVHAETPYTTAQAYLQDVKENPGKFKMGGTGTAQEGPDHHGPARAGNGGEIHLRSLQGRR